MYICPWHVEDEGVADIGGDCGVDDSADGPCSSCLGGVNGREGRGERGGNERCEEKGTLREEEARGESQRSERIRTRRKRLGEGGGRAGEHLRGKILDKVTRKRDKEGRRASTKEKYRIGNKETRKGRRREGEHLRGRDTGSGTTLYSIWRARLSVTTNNTNNKCSILLGKIPPTIFNKPFL
jgi:hypothetical protein